jgi:hypothetical protein
LIYIGICDVNIENVTNKGSLGHDDVDLEQTDDQESPSKRIRIDTGSDLTQILPVFRRSILIRITNTDLKRFTYCSGKDE